MKMRGVRNDATLTTSAYRGIYENKEEKESIMTMIRRRSPDASL
jgi:GTP cyclohydrolase I